MDFETARALAETRPAVAVHVGDYVTHASKFYPPIYYVLSASDSDALCRYFGHLINGKLIMDAEGPRDVRIRLWDVQAVVAESIP